jgi:hypothetical protein
VFGAEKPISWAKPAHFDFFTIHFTVWSHLRSTDGDALCNLNTCLWDIFEWSIIAPWFCREIIQACRSNKKALLNPLRVKTNTRSRKRHWEYENTLKLLEEIKWWLIWQVYHWFHCLLHRLSSHSYHVD